MFYIAYNKRRYDIGVVGNDGEAANTSAMHALYSRNMGEEDVQPGLSTFEAFLPSFFQLHLPDSAGLVFGFRLEMLIDTGKDMSVCCVDRV